MINKLNLEKKFIFIIISSVVMAIAVLTALIVRWETILIQDDYGRNADILAASINTALKDNMLAGRPSETKGLIEKLSGIKGVEKIAVLKPNGGYAFGLSGTAIEMGPEVRGSVLKGHEASFPGRDSRYFIKPLVNDMNCRACHPDNEGIRGIIVVKLSTSDISKNIFGLIKRMAGFGIMASVVLSALLLLIVRRMLISPVKGLTEAANQITLENFVLFRPRGIDCHEMLNCRKTGCPSYKNKAIPCWLESGTLCNGRAIGDFALKLGDCFKCRVYHETRGDEMRQLIDKFNKMSLTMKAHKENVKMHVDEIERVNQELKKSNTKLNTLLDASRLTTSTLELNEILSTSLKIILDVTSLKAGIILLLADDDEAKCHEFFGCDAYNCPAYKAAVNCWRLSGTMCHGDPAACPQGSTAFECWHYRDVHTHYSAVRNFDEKIKSCSSCEFFANIVLIPKMAAGFKNENQLHKKLRLDSSTISQALVKGQTIVNYSRENPFRIPFETSTELAVPLKMQEQMIGVLYLASDRDIHYSREEIEFFQLLSEIISSGIFNSGLYEDMEKSYIQTVMALANAIEAKDPYTKGHTERVARFSLEIAEALNLSHQEKEHLRFAALLHDVGKIGISKDIIWKHCGLDECEEQEIRTHPDKGVQILDPVHFLRPVLSAIRHHHEKYDGSGYPLGLRGGEIPFKARIISVADAWDAMLSNRPYRDALSVEAAIKELKSHAGTQFDPEIVDCFVKFMTSKDI